jgi:hypothetical protein
MGGSEDLRLAKKAIGSGDRVAARAHLFRAIGADPWNEQAWLWLSTVIDDPDKQRECLERALRIDPDHHRARLPSRRQRQAGGPVSLRANVWAAVKRSWLNIWNPRRLLGAGVSLVLLCLFVVGMIGRGTGSDVATAREVQNRCEEYVLAELIAPSTATFSPHRDTAIGRTSDPGQTWIVAGHVDAQNRFGAMLRMRYVCKVRYAGEGAWERLELYVQEP